MALLRVKVIKAFRWDGADHPEDQELTTTEEQAQIWESKGFIEKLGEADTTPPPAGEPEDEVPLPRPVTGVGTQSPAFTPPDQPPAAAPATEEPEEE